MEASRPHSLAGQCLAWAVYLFIYSVCLSPCRQNQEGLMLLLYSEPVLGMSESQDNDLHLNTTASSSKQQPGQSTLLLAEVYRCPVTSNLVSRDCLRRGLSRVHQEQA